MYGHIDYQLIKSVCDEVKGRFPITFTATGVSADSNSIQSGQIYVPVQGEFYDGHQFIEAAMECGAAASFWKKGIELPSTVPDDFPVLYTDDPLKAVRRLADGYLKEVDAVSVAVTGDYSRLVAKKVLSKVLSGSYKVHEAKHSADNEMSVYETVLSMPLESDIIICDVNDKSEETVCHISNLLQPAFSLVCFADSVREIKYPAYAACIEEGMKATGTIIAEGDTSFSNREWKTDVSTYGFGAHNIFQISSKETAGQECVFQLEGVMIDFNVPVLLSGHVKPVVAAVAAAIHLGIGAEQIQRSLSNLTMEDVSLDAVETSFSSVILFDHTDVEESDLEFSLGMLKHMHTFSRRVLIVDEGFQAAPQDKTLHEVFASQVALPVTDVITIGEKAFWVKEALKRKGNDQINSKHFATHGKAVNMFKELIESSSLALYRGANRELLEQIIEELNSR